MFSDPWTSRLFSSFCPWTGMLWCRLGVVMALSRTPFPGKHWVHRMLGIVIQQASKSYKRGRIFNVLFVTQAPQIVWLNIVNPDAPICLWNAYKSRYIMTTHTSLFSPCVPCIFITKIVHSYRAGPVKAMVRLDPPVNTVRDMNIFQV